MSNRVSRTDTNFLEFENKNRERQSNIVDKAQQIYTIIEGYYNFVEDYCIIGSSSFESTTVSRSLISREYSTVQKSGVDQLK